MIHQHTSESSKKEAISDPWNNSLPEHAYRMVDIGKKTPTFRCAVAQGKIYVGEKAFRKIQDKTMPKGDPLILAEVAGITGAKCAFQCIPLCHPLNLDQVIVLSEPNEKEFSIMIYCIVSAFAKTGVEMEALAGVNAALLSIYDLCKIVNKELLISDIYLLYKEGGKSGLWVHSQGVPEWLQQKLFSQTPFADLRMAVISISDRAYQGHEDYPDIGIYLKEELEKLGAKAISYALVPDEKELIQQEIKKAADASCHVIFLRGGTGITKRDVTTQAVIEISDRLIPGFGELLRKTGEQHTPFTWLSCSLGAVLGRSLIVTIPGSKNAIYESMRVLPELLVKAVEELQRF
ncbi:cyclic pyranopterin monophosphate synthase MoaC [Legionella clemsonensis]|uniref:Cyclic pyranopterin monophosphate synthase accessory protein n=1 Tax=Legionella clemsonensis TaxID=1867846 RepID=A0A222P054_9GAMM|nr:cyclic pyranopterin monophosphate synthase MoaC [Legionella clemsonensis]ASQ45165.1 Cyclic pyranopterin monophosphate synthase accessory protein [Legionella clemsonensis]